MTDKDWEEDLYWCGEGCGFVDVNHRCEQWSNVFKIPKTAAARIRAEASEKVVEKAVESVVLQRDNAEDCIDKLLDLIGIDHEWSSVFGFPDAVDAASEKLARLNAEAAREERERCFDRVRAAWNDEGVSFCRIGDAILTPEPASEQED